MSSGSRRYAQAVVEIDAYLRNKSADGTRVNVNYRLLEEPLGYTGTTIQQALLGLSRVKGSGLRSLGKGDYEYKMPTTYPPELAELKASLRQPEPEKKFHGQLRSEVFTFMREHPNEPHSGYTIAAGIGDLDKLKSVQNVLYRLYKVGVFKKAEQFKSGFYVYEPPESQPRTLIIDTLTGAQQTIDKILAGEAGEALGVPFGPREESHESEGDERTHSDPAEYAAAKRFYGLDETAETSLITGLPLPETAEQRDRRRQEEALAALREELLHRTPIGNSDTGNAGYRLPTPATVKNAHDTREQRRREAEKVLEGAKEAARHRHEALRIAEEAERRTEFPIEYATYYEIGRTKSGRILVEGPEGIFVLVKPEEL